MNDRTGEIREMTPEQVKEENRKIDEKEQKKLHDVLTKNKLREGEVGHWQEIPDKYVPLMRTFSRNIRREWLRRYKKLKLKGINEDAAGELALQQMRKGGKK